MMPLGMSLYCFWNKLNVYRCKKIKNVQRSVLHCFYIIDCYWSLIVVVPYWLFSYLKWDDEKLEGLVIRYLDYYNVGRKCQGGLFWWAYHTCHLQLPSERSCFRTSVQRRGEWNFVLGQDPPPPPTPHTQPRHALPHTHQEQWVLAVVWGRAAQTLSAKPVICLDCVLMLFSCSPLCAGEQQSGVSVSQLSQLLECR